MCPKSTSYNKLTTSTINAVLPNQLRKSPNLEDTHLLYHRNSSSIYEFLEITMPYLILYEAVNPETDSSIFFEFSENSKHTYYSTYQDYKAFGPGPLHSHDFYELTFVLSGCLTMQIEDEFVTYYPGDCCLCNKNIHHRELMNENAEIVLFLLKEEFIKNLLDTNYYYDKKGNSHAVGSFFYTLFAENTKNPFYDAKEYIDFRTLDKATHELIIQIINDMISEITGLHSGKSHMMKALLCRFIELMENPKFYERNTHSAKLSNEEEIVHKIASAYEEKSGMFSRSEIEHITGYNSDYVGRIVKRITGKTLSEFGRSFLLKKAVSLLIHTNIGISEICHELGYSNRNYFNKMFIQEYGITPSEFRKQHVNKL